MIRLQAPAKINLTLDVLAKREDGYHEIESIFHSVSLADEVHLTLAGHTSLTYEGFEVPADSSNTALRAVEVFKGMTGWRREVQLHLIKRIPPQAGLGGGSSDGAAVLRGLQQLAAQEGKEVPPSLMLEIATYVGSDVPFFLYGGTTALVKGRGEQVQPLPPLPSFPWVLAKPPDIGISTAWAYSELDRQRQGIEWESRGMEEWGTRRQGDKGTRRQGDKETKREPETRNPKPETRNLLTALQQGSIQTPEALVEYLHNDFEEVVLPAYEPLQALREDLLRMGALRVLLCGSGAAQCAWFKDVHQAHQVAIHLQTAGYWAAESLT